MMRVRLSPSRAALLLVLPGCFSASSSGPPPGEGPADAQGTPVVDATTPGDAAAPVEASAPREAAAPDAAVEAGAQPVTVTIVNSAGPEPGVLIVFQDTSGNVISTASTDALGRVTQVVAPGSQVTAVMGSPPVQGSDAAAFIPPPVNVQLVTVQGIEPGDTLSLVDPSDTTLSSVPVVIDALPDAAPPPGTASYTFQAGKCADIFDTNVPAQFTLSQDCQDNGTFPVLVGAQGGQDAGYAYLGYTWQDTNQIATDGGVTHVTMSGTWSTALTTPSVELANIPAWSQTPYATYGELAGGVDTPQSTSLPETDGGGLATFQGHPAFAAAVQTEAMLYTNETSGNLSFIGVSAIATRTPSGSDAGVSFDMSTALPLITSLVQDAGAPAADSGQSSQPYAAWSSDAGSLPSLSGVVVQFGWTRSGGSGAWTIVAPPTATSVTAPVLPPQVAGWTPGPGAFSAGPPMVVLVQASFLPTYAAFRGQFATFPATGSFVNDEFQQGGIIPAVPVNGTVRISGVTRLGS